MDKRKARKAKYRAENKDKMSAYQAKYYAENKDRESLSNNYIKKLLISRSRIVRKDIPPELIELKRIQIKITREIRNQAQ